MSRNHYDYDDFKKQKQGESESPSAFINPPPSINNPFSSLFINLQARANVHAAKAKVKAKATNKVFVQPFISFLLFLRLDKDYHLDILES